MPYFGNDEEHMKGVKKPFIFESFGRCSLGIFESETPRGKCFQGYEMASTTVTPVPSYPPNLTNTQQRTCRIHIDTIA